MELTSHFAGNQVNTNGSHSASDHFSSEAVLSILRLIFAGAPLAEVLAIKEEELAACLGEPLTYLQVPRTILEQIVNRLREDQKHVASRVNTERSRMEGRLTAVRNGIDAAYADKLDGKISKEFWGEKDRRLAARGAAGETRSPRLGERRNGGSRFECREDFRTGE